MLHQIEFLGYKFLEVVINAVPFSIVQTIGKLGGRIFYFLFFARRKIAVSNIQTAFPEKTKNEVRILARRSFENIGMTLFEFLRLKKITGKQLERIITYDDNKFVSKTYNQNKGTILLSGHIGNWELLAARIGVSLFHPLKVIIKTQHNEKVNREINRIRTKFGNEVIPMEQAIKVAMSTLKEQKFLALLSDQSAPKESVYVNFFGRNVATFKGPASFCLKTRAHLFMLFCIRQKNRTYKVLCEEIMYDDLQEYSEENVQILTQRHTATLENIIRQHPEQWLWMHRRWKNVQ
jgi:KDO2-lipid IV(A) lauroyltransferase